MSEKTITAAVLVIVGAMMGIPALLVLTSCVNGWVLSKLWLWFMVPVFHLPVLSLWSAIGLAIVVRFLTFHDTESKRKFGEVVLLALIQPLFALGFGALIHWLGR